MEIVLWKRNYTKFKRNVRNCGPLKLLKNLEILFSSRMVAVQSSRPINFFVRCLFGFRGGVNKEPVPVQSLRDLMQEEEQKTNVPTPTPTPRIPIASGKSGSARKKLKYSRWLTQSFVIPVHTMPDKFENVALFLRLGQPSTLIRHENWAFRNALQTGGN